MDMTVLLSATGLSVALLVTLGSKWEIEKTVTIPAAIVIGLCSGLLTVQMHAFFPESMLWLVIVELGWLGPKGTITGFHFDYADGLLAQVCGQKFVQLVSPQQSPCMYPSTKFDYGSKLCRADSRQFDPQEFPRFAEVRMQVSHLNPGQMLYIPHGWWHQVESLSAS